MAGYIGSKASVVSSGTERKRVFDITTTTTSLTGLAYTPNQVNVFHNGVRLVDGTDFTATNGSTITLTTAAENGDQVVVLSSSSFQLLDAVPVTGGTFTGTVTFNSPTVGAGGGLFKGENGTVGNSAGDIFRVNEQVLNTNVTISSTENANATGPLTVASGITLTVDSGGSLAIV